MAEVLTVPRQPDGQSFYSSSLRRSSPSQSSFLVGSPPSSYSSSHKSTYARAEHTERLPDSVSASELPSPQHPAANPGHTPSLMSAPAGGASLGIKYEDDEEIIFPSYDGVHFVHHTEDFDPPPSPKIDESTESQDESATTGSTRSDSPLPTPTVADDSALKHEPSRHVDYLSHDWREEDIWSSWRHIVSQRKVYGQRSRLENASWRTWAKSKYHLRTVSPETLNWLKESDVTWLYGPLQPASSHPITYNMSEPQSRISKNNSFIHKKPILKKRSMSEVMLQKCISASSLVKHAAAAVQAQQKGEKRRPSYNRARSEYFESPTSPHAESRETVSVLSSCSTSGGQTPCDAACKRHIRFDDKVEQCIAVECKDGEYDDEEEEYRFRYHGDDSDSSDEGVVMMKRPRRRRSQRSSPPSSSVNGSRMIEKVPSTTLKYRTDSPDVPEQASTPFTRSWSSKKLSPSPSQETLRPSHPSSNFLLGDDEDD
ncbi:protein phosphatase regulator, partial [Elasticomyces elasticus]